jgi:transposase
MLQNQIHQKVALCAGMPTKVGALDVVSISVPAWGKVINADLNGAINILHIPESQGAKSEGQLWRGIGVTD